MQEKDSLSCQIEESFKKSSFWNLLGGSLYELTKIIHHLALMYLLPQELFGFMGMLFSSIYLSVKIADFGATYTLAAFFKRIMYSKQWFKHLLCYHFLLPHGIGSIIVSFATIAIYHRLLPGDYLDYLLIMLITVSETFRCFLRYLLHFTFKSSTVVLVELSSFAGYLIMVWYSFAHNSSLTITTFLACHALESLTVMMIFLVITATLIRHLPNKSETYPASFARVFWKTRLFNFFIRIHREFFSGNFLTPLIAFKNGLLFAGPFYVISIIATSLQNIIKMVIGYSGNALLAQVKESSLEHKKNAFALISAKAINLLLPMALSAIFLLGNGFSMTKQPYSGQQIIIFLFFFTIIFIVDFFTMLYDQFYLLEEASWYLLRIKTVEYLGYSLVLATQASLPDFLLKLSLIRIISLFGVAYGAHSLWNIKPSLQTKRTYLWIAGGLLIISLISPLFLTRFFH